MVEKAQQAKAESLRALHSEGVLVLPNAWDAGSAAVIAAAGAKAIATTSGGVAWSRGRTDGHGLTREEMIEQVRRIAAAVDVPVTADVEGGYGPTPEDVAKTVEAAVEAGAVGVNLEDSVAPGGPLFDVQEQAARLRAARAAAEAAGLPELVINVRTDVFLFGIGEPEGRLDEAIARAAAYAEAGADSLFVPGLVDLDALAVLVKATDLPVNVMAWPGAPSVAEFEAAGVRRVSLGTAVAQSAYTVARRAAVEALTKGTYEELGDSLDFGTMNSFFAR
ncbi:isocitrate lyase/phosphoenolpyruvate mutase family protein [Kitasatospora griseola]|uniref:isocitrate lyase/PEP mutase family protein n=1 Tax=Kitasatospora griseola TaxID=2064 RepID=UPI003855F3CB